MKVYFLFVAHVTICYIIPIVLEIKHARQYYICNNAILDKGETMTFFESKKCVCGRTKYIRQTFSSCHDLTN